MNKPIKPNITIPQSFAENGIKTDFDSDLLTDGFDNLRPDVLAGDNLNKFIDDTYKGLNYGIAAADAINLIQEGETLTVQNGQLVSGSTGGGLEVCDIGTALYIDETKGLRRYLNGQIVDINTNTQAFLDRLLQIQTTNPDYFTTEDNWQAEATLNIDGCVYKFVLNYADDGETVVSVRLPKYPDYVEINAGGTLPVYGNGNTLGLTDGNNEFGLAGAPSYYAWVAQNMSNKTLPYIARVSGALPGVDSGVGVTRDYTKSGIVANLDQTKLKMRYFIQIATGSETENNIINEIELNNPFSLLDYKYSEYELNNLSWLKSEGQWNAKAVYPKAYDKILENVNKGIKNFKSTNTYYFTNTIDGTEYWRATATRNPIVGSTVYNINASANKIEITGTVTDVNGDTITVTDTYRGTLTLTFRQITSEPVWQTDYDFVLNTADETFRLPLKTLHTDNTVDSLSLYYYVGETVQNANLIDAGRIGEQLVNHTAQIHIIDTYVNGTSGYRIWSDGYCEQWGQIHTPNSNTNYTISLLKTFKNVNYNIQLTSVGQDGGIWEANPVQRTNQSFVINVASNGGGFVIWVVRGYLAEGQ